MERQRRKVSERKFLEKSLGEKGRDEKEGKYRHKEKIKMIFRNVAGLKKKERNAGNT